MSRALVTGGAGFIGSHLCDRLIAEEWEVVCVYNLLTGRKENIEQLLGHERFSFLEQDVCEPFEVDGPLDWVIHLASPASPVDYQRYPLETLRVNAEGTRRMLDLALEKRAAFLLASTSEVYGDPQVHPQPETYWGNVNPVGVRSSYDEGKRYAEALTMAYHRVHGLGIRIARIFNTYGPRMRLDDGRVVPTFIRQALAGEPLTVHGDGSQTRSLCYVDDLVEGLVRLVHRPVPQAVNLGGTQEMSVLDLARLILELTRSPSDIVFVPLADDDPSRRCPDISLARQVLGWEPRTDLREGLRRTVDHFREVMASSRGAGKSGRGVRLDAWSGASRSRAPEPGKSL